MKYFLFNKGFPYYSLVVANSEEEAVEEYIDVVSDLDDDESPLELSIEEVLKEIGEADFESDEEEKVKLIEAVQGNGFFKKEVLLIDTSLI